MRIFDQPNRLTGLRYYQIADLLHLENITEDAGPNNDSRGYITKFLADCGLGPRQPWCAAMVTSCLLAAGVPKASLPTGPASTYNWMQWAHSKGILSKVWRGVVIQKGDLFVWNDNWQANGARVGHIGIVVGVDVTSSAVRLRTIEGNSNGNGSRNGIALMRRGPRSGIAGEAHLTPNTTESWRNVSSKMYRIAMPQALVTSTA